MPLGGVGIRDQDSYGTNVLSLTSHSTMAAVHGVLFVFTPRASAARLGATTQSLKMPSTKQSSKIGQFKASAERLALTLRLATPLYDKLLGDLEQVGEQGRAFVVYTTKPRFFGSLLTVDFFGHDLPKPMLLAVKMERLLQTASQRQLHLDKRTLPQDHKLGEDDMKQVYNEWRSHPKAWMQSSSYE